jgi:hypothetical protein
MEYKFEDIDKNDCHLSLQEWKNDCGCGGFIDYDGYGYFATETQQSDIQVYPSDYWDGSRKRVDAAWFEPDWATHIVWYNR